jgi:hypothetical protein
VAALLEAVRERARRGPSAAAPWSADQLGRVVMGNVVGAGLVLLGSYQSATADEVVRNRLTWLAVGIAGLVLAGLANGLWMASVRARVRLGRGLVLAEVAQLVPSTEVGGPATSVDVVVTAPGMTRYHRPGCELAQGKPTRRLSERQRRAGRLRACEVCLGGGGPA